MPSDTYLALVLKADRLYAVFGSGANHGINTQFMTQASAMNNGKWIGLLRGAGTRFALILYPPPSALSKKALLATVYSPFFTTQP